MGRARGSSASLLYPAAVPHRKISGKVSIALAETYRLLSRSLRLPRAERLTTVRRLLESEVLEFDDGEGVMRAYALAAEGADFADALIQGAMELFGVERVVTFDRRAADRLGWELLNA